MLLRRQFTPGFEDIFDHGVNSGWYDINDPIEKSVFSCPLFSCLTWFVIDWSSDGLQFRGSKLSLTHG